MFVKKEDRNMKKWLKQRAWDVICFDIVMIAITLGMSFGASYFAMLNFNSLVDSSYKTVKWQSIDKAQKNYNIFKSAFNSQKQAVVDAYNKQIDEINKNGLETEADFTGLRFNNNVFTDKINSNDQVLSYSSKATKAVNKLSKITVATKIAKIKAFYDARVRNVYSALKNEQKVMFSSLTEYDRQPKNIQLTEADFTPVATKIVDAQVFDCSSDGFSKFIKFVLVAICMFIAVTTLFGSGELFTELADELF